MIIFGGTGGIHDIFRQGLTDLCVEYLGPKNLSPDELAHEVWTYINTVIDPLGNSDEIHQKFIDRIAKAIYRHPDDIEQLTEQAKAGDEAARHHIADLTQSLARQELPTPEPFALLLADILTGHQPLTKAKGRPKQTVRDQKIVMVIEVLLRCHPDLSPFRNEVKRIKEDSAPSACSLACEMLTGNGITLGEKAIEAIYTNHCLT